MNDNLNPELELQKHIDELKKRNITDFSEVKDELLFVMKYLKSLTKHLKKGSEIRSEKMKELKSEVENLKKS
jgi:hypothetical protein